MFSWLSERVVRQKDLLNGSLLVCKCWSHRRVYTHWLAGLPEVTARAFTYSPAPPLSSSPTSVTATRLGFPHALRSLTAYSGAERNKFLIVSNQDIPSFSFVHILTSRNCRYYRNDERSTSSVVTALSTVCCHHIISSARPRGTYNFR